jgi:MYXO-CTERM domain-containing protein
MKARLLLAALPLLLTWPANAQTTQPAQEQPTTTEQTTTGQTTDTATQATRDDDNDMDWGWIGLLGLIGLAGLARRREPVVTTRTTPVGPDTTRTGPRP